MHPTHKARLQLGVSPIDGFDISLLQEGNSWLARIDQFPSIAVAEDTPEEALCTLVKVWWELKSSYKADGFYPPTAENPRVMWIC